MSESEIQHIKIYGPKRSGTNYLEQLLRQNVDIPHLPTGAPSWVSILSNYVLHASGWQAHPVLKDWYNWATYSQHLGWKHTIVQPDSIPEKKGRRTLFLAIVKNPYAWILSAHKSPHCPEHPDLESFLTSSWPTLGRENHTEPVYASPMHVWNKKAQSYIQLERTTYPVETFCYEEILESPEETVRDLEGRYRLPLCQHEIMNVERSTSKDETAKSFEDFRDYYLGREWCSDLQPHHAEIINRHIDLGTMTQYGYSPFSPEESQRKI